MAERIRYRQLAWAQRLLLARITDDHEAGRIVRAEIGCCPYCLVLVATYLLRLATMSMVYAAGCDELAAQWVLDGLAYTPDQADSEAQP